MKRKVVLVTGAAGFIGARVSEYLLNAGYEVVGIDNLNDYYDVRLKNYRLGRLQGLPRFHFFKRDIENQAALRPVFRRNRFYAVLNLAARAGVPASVKNPYVYVSTNILGALNLLELAREYRVPKFFLASSSSLYAGQHVPFSEKTPASTPYSPYAATKIGAEALCHSYHYLYGMDMVVARYFTVYGPAGRPDMAPFRFIRWIHEGSPVLVHGNGAQSRDFTYVDDIASGTIKALSLKGFHVLNLGGNRPCGLMGFIRLIEKCVGRKAIFKKGPRHMADAPETWADIRQAKKLLGWQPEVPIEEGVRRTAKWYLDNLSWASKIR